MFGYIVLLGGRIDAGTEEAKVIEAVPDVPGKTTKCSICLQTGHNEQTCDTGQAHAWQKRHAAIVETFTYVIV